MQKTILAIGFAIAFFVCGDSYHTRLQAAGKTDAKRTAVDSKNASAILDTLFIAPQITVEAERTSPVDELFNRSGFVAMVDLGERRDRVEDLSSILSQVVGLRVKQYGGLGAFATVSIRGSSSNQVQVYLDGIPLNDPYTGATNLADLPLGGVQRLEVFRGFAPPQLGTAGIGGVLNLVTTDTTKWLPGRTLSRLEFNNSYGSFGTSKHQLSLWSQFWKLKCHVHGGYLYSTGDFEFIDDQGTPENIADDVEVKRINNAYTAWNFLGRTYLDIPRAGSLSLTHNMVLREQGVPGFGFYQSAHAHYDRDRHISYLRFDSRPLLSRRLHTSTTGFYSVTREKFDDPLGEVSFNKQGPDNKITSYGVTGRVRIFAPVLPLTADVSFEGKKERYHPQSQFPTPTSGPDRLRDSYALYTGGELYLLNQTLVLSAAERFEGHSNEFYDDPLFPWLPPTPQGKFERDEQTPHFGFRWQMTSFATVKGNWGRYHRLPTFLELFGNLGSVTGNSTLEAEEGLNRDIGLILSRDALGVLNRVFLEVVYLNNTIDNLILFFPNSQHTSKPTNIGSAHIKGWEMSFSSSFRERLRLSGNYTRLDTEDTSSIPYYSGNQLAGRPLNEFSLFIDWLHTKGRIGYELHYIGANFIDRANLKDIPSREIHNLVVRIDTPLKGLSLTAEGRNLTNNRISDVSGFPLPGRTLYATLSYQY
jgi:iron complex outermembrane receptor protein